MIPKIPTPESSTRCYSVHGLFSIPIFGGLFDSGTQNLPDLENWPITELQQVTSGGLYRVVSYSISSNVEEIDLTNAFINPNVSFPVPTVNLVWTPGNVGITPKPFPIVGLSQEIDCLHWFRPVSSNVQLGFFVSGIWDGNKLPGLNELVFGLKVTMQELADQSWKDAYDERKF
jgi:hypothetical protein